MATPERVTRCADIRSGSRPNYSTPEGPKPSPKPGSDFPRANRFGEQASEECGETRSTTRDVRRKSHRDGGIWHCRRELGVRASLPCCPGICDYCDSKKSDAWQPYAAVV